jgi:hypothetical protein
MAIFHLSSQIIKRDDGRSAVACAAYRAGEELYDERYGKPQTFQREDRVVSSEIISPAFAKPWATDRAQLWNSLETIELRKKAQLAKEIEVALPNDLTLKQQRELLAGWVDEHFTQKGIVADVNIHRAPIGADYYNDHAHVMAPLRGIDPETGNWKKCKERSFLDKKTELEQLRASWAAHVNSALKKAGIDDQQVDHRSHKRRGITDVQPGIHEGYAAQGIEKRGGRSWRADLNRQIRQTNQRILAEIKAKAVATYRAFTKGLAQKLAADAIGLELTPAAQTPAAKKPEPVPAPIEAKPEPTRLPAMPPQMRPDKLAGGAAYTAPTPAPKPVLQPPPMRPDKVAGGPEPMMPDQLTGGPEPILAPKKQEPVPAPIAAKPQPAKLPEMPAIATLDAEAEKRKKDGHRNAWLQRGGGNGVGG